jgi:hypothetical protein
MVIIYGTNILGHGDPLMGRRGRRFSFALLLGLLVCLAGIMPRHQAAAGEFKGAPSPPAKNVLLLYAYPAMMPAIFEWDEAM